VPSIWWSTARTPCAIKAAGGFHYNLLQFGEGEGAVSGVQPRVVVRSQRDQMAAPVRIAANLRAVAAAHVPFQFMDGRCLRSAHDVQGNGLVASATASPLPAVARTTTGCPLLGGPKQTSRSGGGKGVCAGCAG